VTTIEAEAVVPASPEEVFAFLSDLDNHWQLADRFVEMVHLENASPKGRANGGRVRIRGPLGISRTASTRVVATEAPHSMRGTAELGDGTCAKIEWRFAREGGGTRIRLGAEVESASRLDRLLLVAGGSLWLRHRFGKILQELATRFGDR
jgi:uncharacterized protein YndB with AHSA1/START domain